MSSPVAIWHHPKVLIANLEDGGDMTEDCIGMVIAIFGYYFSMNNIDAAQILYYTADK